MTPPCHQSIRSLVRSGMTAGETAMDASTISQWAISVRSDCMPAVSGPWLWPFSLALSPFRNYSWRRSPIPSRVGPLNRTST